jgi:putative membrane protein
VVFVAACADDDDDVQLQPTVDAGGPLDAAVDVAPLEDGGIHNDSQITHVVITANNGEIDQGTLAELKITTGPVRSFAEMMVTEHGAANQRAQALAQSLGITPLDNPVSAQLKSESDALIARLQPLEGQTFEVAYMDSQVTGHTQVLDLVDTVLLPAATAPQLTAELQTMRTAVAAHLQEAQRIRAELGDAGAADAGGDADAEAGPDSAVGNGPTY